MKNKERQARNLFAICIFIFLTSAQQTGTKATPCSDSLKRAIALIDRDQDKDALACLNSLIAKDPRSARAFCERSRIYARSKAYDKAMYDCNKAISIEPKLGKAYAYRAAIHLDQLSFEKALTDSNKAVSLEPGSFISYLIRAQVHQAMAHHKKAVEDCNRALILDSNNAKIYVVRAISNRELRLYQESLNDCNSALKISPEKAMPHIERGLTYLGVGKTKNAIDDYTEAIRIRQDYALPYVLRSIAFGMLGQFEKQIADLSRAASMIPNNERVFELRSSAYYELGALDQALKDCAMVIALNPAASKGYLIAAKCYEELGLYEKAIAHRSKLLQIEKQNASFWSERARDYYKLGKVSLAKADWRRAKQLASRYELFQMQLDNPLVDFMKTHVESNELSVRAFTVSTQHLDCKHIGVPCAVNSKSLNLMLDTGCAHTQLWKGKLVPSAHQILPLWGKRATGEKYSYGFFVARSLKFGTVAFSHIPITIDGELKNHEGLSGFLGGNLLENFAVKVDYENKKLSVAESQMQGKSKKSIVVPMTLRNHCPYCKVKLNGTIEVSALLDTGSPDSLAPDSLLGSGLTEKLNYSGQIDGPWLGRLRSQLVDIKRIELGRENIGSIVLNVYRASDAPSVASEITLGNDFLSRFKSVTFDYPNRKVVFEIL
ncbi:MAG: hypothetical protein LCH63_11140 [Candidatus Melainabacteria bacterium]|nr:hypothetical protein [Candidatus Melainabacteria bacterium]